uniref:Uncharacterized protein n=1 Tax=Anguilla anguilla TaxID=7936 RepID=A0A0E9PXF6_ANGAN
MFGVLLTRYVIGLRRTLKYTLNDAFKKRTVHMLYDSTYLSVFM